MMVATHYYIWYRISGDPARARTAVNELLREIALHAGVTGRLLIRRDDPSTWMEIFENVVDTTLFDTVLAESTERCGIEECAPGGRHVERFASAP
jgi:Domain of unknown function (DUF4936)